MKRIICCLLTVVMLCALMLPLASPAGAAGQKQEVNRTIAIVFDNSGSMYTEHSSPQDHWCRATYAMEVFASMLNDGDLLMIYPMWGVNTDGGDNAVYSDTNPIRIDGPGQAGTLRQIYTPSPGGTPIETIDKAYNGLMQESGEQWLIVLTDGTDFHKGGTSLEEKTKDELNNRLSTYSKDVNVLYLGIGSGAVEPDASTQGHTLDVKKASSSSEVLSMLTDMCNQIFGRDTLPSSHLQGTNMHLDVSISKLIAFVQGDNVSDLKVKNASGGLAGAENNSRETHYPERGNGRYEEKQDTSLQGMMVTYENVSIGDYQVDFGGSASSIEVYYEPNVDLEFTFTDENGNEVPPDQLYEGNYKISYGMKDGITGEYTDSPLLGKTVYDGSYTINGQETPIHAENKSGEVQVSLKEGDNFDCRMTVSYLSGYQITKEGSEFGLPTEVTARPPADFRLELSGGQPEYEVIALDDGAPFRVEAFYDGQKLTGSELEAVDLQVDQSKSEAVLNVECKNDHYEIKLAHKDPGNPDATEPGSYTIPVTGTYKAPGAEETTASGQFQYTISRSKPNELKLSVVGGPRQIEVSSLGQCDPFRIEVFYGSDKLTGDALNAVDLKLDDSGSEAALTLECKDEWYEVGLAHKDPGNPEATKTGSYSVPVSANYTAPGSEPASASAELAYDLILTPPEVLRLQLSGGQSAYELTTLQEGEPFRAEVFYGTDKLTSDALKAVEITWDPALSGALLEKVFQEDHWDIVLSHKDKNDPEATPTGEYTVPLTAVYQAPSSDKAESEPEELKYTIEDNRTPLRVKLKASQTYYVISKLAEGDPIRAEITIEGRPLTSEEFAKTAFTATCDGLKLRQEPLPEESAYLLYLEKDGATSGDFVIKCEASQTDEIGRTTTVRDKVTVTLSTIPLWLKWAIVIGGILFLAFVIYRILHIKALPSKLNVRKRDSSMNVGGTNVTKNATFGGSLSKNTINVHSSYAGKKIGIIMDVKKRKGSYLMTPQAKRSADVISSSVRKKGNATITGVTIGTARYVLNKSKNKLERFPVSDKPITIKNGANITYTGTLMSNGLPTNFSVVTKLNFKKK